MAEELQGLDRVSGLLTLVIWLAAINLALTSVVFVIVMMTSSH